MANSKIIFSHSFEKTIKEWIQNYDNNKIFLATEENVNKLWVNNFNILLNSYKIKKVIVPSGEKNKNLDSVKIIWKFLSDYGADRKSMLINIGGGMLTDLAGFAASTFKRGINFLNVPTTLLSQVDASTGGKTGINFNGLKNEIGSFREPVAVIINTDFLKTLDHKNFLSGFAEMIKHGLIKSPAHLEELKNFDLDNVDYLSLQQIIANSLDIKKYFVDKDPKEKNIRKALNFGHTAGHAFESLALEQERSVLHGYAVAWGMITELFLSKIKCGFDETELNELTNWLFRIYGRFKIDKSDFERLLNLMIHDKKNEAERINFSLISKPGQIEINKNCEKILILRALDYFNTFRTMK
jgi:3-dehydroquinate synthase